MPSKSWSFSWNRGKAEVSALGAMVGPVEFELDDGRVVQPFAVAPWADDTGREHEELPGVLKSLRGEWPCVPFGAAKARRDLPRRWLRDLGDDPPIPGDDIHGVNSNAVWRLNKLEVGAVDVGIDYPSGHPVRRMRRTIAGLPGVPALSFSLEVEARENTALPIGLHPVFRLPDQVGGASLSFSGDVRVHSSPLVVEPGVSRFLPDQEDMELNAIRQADGTTVDATRHPLPFDTEELLLVRNHGGRVDLRNETESYSVTLEWDAGDFPSCLIWISNRGRKFYPWNGRFQALGIEPVAAAFDLGVAHSRNRDNPLSDAGVACTANFKAGRIWRSDYRISVGGL